MSQTAKQKPLELVTSVDVAAPGTTRRAANRQNARMVMLAQQWETLTFTQKSAWNLTNATMQTPMNPANNAVKNQNGWTAFYACNCALVSANQSVVHTPAAYNAPINLPPLSVKITNAGTGLTPVITLTPNNAYAAGPVIAVWATAPAPLGGGTPGKFSASSYFKIGTLTGGIPLTGVNIVAQYLSVFPSVPASCKIGFKLMAVNPGGYHSPKVSTFGTAPAVSEADAPSGPRGK